MSLISRAILSVTALAVSLTASSQDWNNWVRTIEPLSVGTQLPELPDITDPQLRVSTLYSDGLGRDKATVKTAFTGAERDVADYIEYDSQGRVARQWLPINTLATGATMPATDFPTLAVARNNDLAPYTETLYDGTDGERVSERVGPGEAWRDDNGNHSVKHRYLFNNLEPYMDEEEDFMFDLSCLYYYVGSNGQLRVLGEYANSTLRIDLATNEDGLHTATFTDKSGKTLLVRRYNDGNWECADTYWVYDIYGRLRYVIPPQAVKEFYEDNHTGYDRAVSTAIIDKLCFRYEYDDRDRLVVKKMPGMAEKHFVYDRLNRPVMTQDGEQRKAGEWTVTKHDARHRVALVGRCHLPGATRESLQAQWGDSLLLARFVPGHDMEFDLGYVQQCGPYTTPDRAWYYDSHDHWTGLVPITGLTTPMGEAPQFGWQTGTAVTDFAGTVTVTATATDRNGRVTVEAERDLYAQDHALFTTMSYDFAGRMTEKQRTTALVVEQTVQSRHNEQWEYDHDRWDRLKQIRYKPGAYAWMTLAEYTYNAKGRLSKAKLAGNDDLEIGYTYNLRGWPTSISGSSFLSLGYHSGISGLENTMGGATFTPRWGGDISCMMQSHHTISGSHFRWRSFGYDRLGRLATVHEDDDSRFHESYSYDLNGNVTGITHGWPLRYDNISITYNGNRIAAINETPDLDDMLGEIPQLTQGAWQNPVGYDDDGRVVRDDTRGITQIYYNPLGLPTQVRMGANMVVMSYRADGVKTLQQTRRSYIVPVTHVDPATGDTVVVNRTRTETVTRRYVGDMVLETGRPHRIYNEVGFTDWHTTQGGGDSVVFHYFERDHLGSVVAVLNSDGCIEEATDYLACGTPSTALPVTIDNHRHGGKEWLGFAGLGWHDNRARWHDALLMRFTTPDPLAEKYPDTSPYAFCANNPMNLLDDTGLDWYMSRDGEFIWDNEVTSRKDTPYGGLYIGKQFMGITVYEYQPRNESSTNESGISIFLGCDLLNNDLKALELNWFQTITTNSPTRNNISPYIDSEDHRFYLTEDNKQELESYGWTNRHYHDFYFKDMPGRPKTESYFWNANLSLVSQVVNVAELQNISLEYGYSVDNGLITLSPLKFQFTNRSINHKLFKIVL